MLFSAAQSEQVLSASYVRSCKVVNRPDRFLKTCQVLSNSERKTTYDSQIMRITQCRSCVSGELETSNIKNLISVNQSNLHHLHALYKDFRGIK
jgi:hypothetical protein